MRTLLIVSAVLCGGCMPRVVVRKSPDAHDPGVRYYRPKPYLKIEPAEVAVSKTESSLMPGLVRISLVYLPDFSEEYSISVFSGLGTADVGIKLEDGWNLTEINQDLDSQTDENIEAAGRLLTAVGGLVPTAESAGQKVDVAFTVPARNVPLGFYESVVGRDGCGSKRLYGFRYVGFLPFAGCPIDMTGSAAACCQDGFSAGGIDTSLYGLTFVGGEMVFQPLTQMALAPAASAVAAIGDRLERTAADGQAAGSAADPSAQDRSPVGRSLPPDPTADLPEISPTQLRAYLNENGLEVDGVDVSRIDNRLVVRIDVPVDTPTLPISMTVNDWLKERIANRDNIDVQIRHTPDVRSPLRMPGR